MSAVRGCGPVLLILAMAACLPARAQDVYSGTLHVDGEGLVLRRCDLVGNTYRLRDVGVAPGAPVAIYLTDASHRAAYGWPTWWASTRRLAR